VVADHGQAPHVRHFSARLQSKPSPDPLAVRRHGAVRWPGRLESGPGLNQRRPPKRARSRGCRPQPLGSTSAPRGVQSLGIRVTWDPSPSDYSAIQRTRRAQPMTPSTPPPRMMTGGGSLKTSTAAKPSSPMATAVSGKGLVDRICKHGHVTAQWGRGSEGERGLGGCCGTAGE
jgi:hypothetical protein